MRITTGGKLSTSQNQLLKKRYTGIQPQYFPRLHYFARILNTDVFVIRDEAQFVRKHKYPDGSVDKSYQAHTPVKQSFGRQLLAVPTRHKGFNSLIETIIYYDHNWMQDHLKTLRISYGKSLNFSRLYGETESILNSKYPNLASLNNATIFWGILNLLGEMVITPDKLNIEYVNDKLKIQNTFRLREVIKASETNSVKSFGDISANEKIVALCKETGASEDYCGGTGASAYMDENIFSKNGIKVTVQDWKCREYPQQFSKQGYIANLSIVDLLMNLSAKEALEILYS